MGEIASGVNWLAVILGAVVSFLAGWLWYSPKLFGPKWAEGVGVEMGTANEMPVGAMVSQIVGLLLLSWFVGVTAAAGMLLTVILGTIAFALLGYSGGMFRKNSAYARVTDLGYLVCSVVIMIIIQGLL
ncbi:DUF1761 domain-containing protein [Hoeflea prorocentri]|uniref:DUF1761 domain-containing protein n=1 Tax=Hoeflea prorocentri TaxID=1922333 RepID=A0A9X3ZH71_9HYPH|nr:DUF1761 domain-containing protein [Hoeflea prorocentri]MCY6381522.1 DUF1761 domain-containing protein [Hoeflea prorocentri]MDA5399322.1 DUF1761 domain-containing protein [Hoeflea prorocentri]